MLLQLRETTPLSAIFTALNDELVGFLARSITATDFSRQLFGPLLGDVLWDNQPTKAKFEALWGKLREIQEADRRAIVTAVQNYQDVSLFFGALNGRPPDIPKPIAEALEGVTRHLYARTSQLSAIGTTCDQTILEHYQSFRAVNGKVCCACGIHILSEFRANVEDEDQWRSAFDHVLAISRYPSYGVHAKNLIPCCDHCNSKAKGAKDVLRNEDQTPRLAFDPLSECCHNSVAVELAFGDICLTPQVTLRNADSAVQQKINTWNSLYMIKDRIEGWLLDWISMTATECPADDLNEFRERLREAGEHRLERPRLEGLYFWKGRFFDWAANLDDTHLQILHAAILEKRSDQDFLGVFGI